MTVQQKCLKHVSRVGDQLASIPAALPADAEHGAIRSLCLHGNCITQCTGLDALTALTELNLSSNSIASLAGLPGLPELCLLNMASNRLQDLSHLPQLPALTRLNCAHNSINSLHGLTALHVAKSPLETLDLRNNRIDQLTELAALTPVTTLRKLQLSGGARSNGIACLPTLAIAVATALPQVHCCRLIRQCIRAKLA